MENKEIIERLDRIEKKLSLLIECFGGVDYIGNGYQVVNDLFGIQEAVNYLNKIFKIAFPKAQKKYREADEWSKLQMMKD